MRAPNPMPQARSADAGHGCAVSQLSALRTRLYIRSLSTKETLSRGCRKGPFGILK
jgi:hypothetical protein